MRSTCGSKQWTFRFMLRHVVEPWNYAPPYRTKSLNTAVGFSLSPPLATGLHLDKRRPNKAARKKRELREP